MKFKLPFSGSRKEAEPSSSNYNIPQKTQIEQLQDSRVSYVASQLSTYPDAEAIQQEFSVHYNDNPDLVNDLTQRVVGIREARANGAELP